MAYKAVPGPKVITITGGNHGEATDSFTGIIHAEGTIPLVEADSRLGWEPSMEYMGDKACIEWKIRHTKYIIDTEIGNKKRSAQLGGEV